MLTLTEVPDAVQYQAVFFPEVSVIAGEPPEQYQGADELPHSWRLDGEG